MARGIWHLMGGGSLDPSELTAEPWAVLAPYTAGMKGMDEPGTGTMVNRGAANQTLNAGQSYTIPAGYHNGEGKVTANSLAGQTAGTAVAGDIYPGKTAWVNGAQVTGTMPLGYGGTYTPQAYAQTVYCDGARMIGNIVINPVPSNFIDTSHNQSVFLNGVFGKVINLGWFKAQYTPKGRITIGSTTLLKSTSEYAISLENNSIRIKITYSTSPKGWSHIGSINLTPYRKLRITATGITIPNSTVYVEALVFGTNKLCIKDLGEDNITKESRIFEYDISDIRQQGYIYVGIDSSSSSSPIVDINEITLIP